MSNKGNFYFGGVDALARPAWTYEADYRHRMPVGLRRIVALI